MRELKVRLSVLALSSRFDGPASVGNYILSDNLSVLALSSRFDGQLMPGLSLLGGAIFQYSLCRVVLMVVVVVPMVNRFPYFQYSLCRVVLMVFAV